MTIIVWQSELDYETVWSGCEQYTESIEEIAEEHVFNSIKNCQNVEEFNECAYNYYSNQDDKWKHEAWEYNTWYEYHLFKFLDKYYFK